MKAVTLSLTAILAAAFFASSLSAQTFARSPSPQSSNNPQLDMLIKKIDEQNAKIDMLSQQILKLQQEMSGNSASSSSGRPGVMIGESASSSPAPSTPVSAPHTAPASTTGTNSHVVSRGETLTSIAKMYKVTVDELQKYNHIENPLKLQVGQTIMIPGSSTPSASPSGGE